MSAGGSYQLGVDLGTTYTAAAIARDGQCRMVGLGNRSAAIPSVVHVAANGGVLAGEAADRRGPSEPERVAREFKRRVGDPTPLLLGGTPYSAEALLGTLLDAVVAGVSKLEGGPPSHLAVTHPANWGPYKQELFTHCLRVADITSSGTLTEPEAAAIGYAANERVEPGSLVAVYDLGGGTFDVAILRKTIDGFAILGRPDGIERLGGIDFDEAVVGHVRAALRGALDAVDVSDPTVLTALTRLRRECIEAKEALSSDTEVTIPVLVPGVQTEVRLTRAEFEQMIRPTLESTIDAMRRALTAAAVEPHEISTVLLVGGSSRIPLIAELVSRAFGRPIAVDAHPKHAIALGAAHAASLLTTDAAVTPHDAQVLPFSTAAGGAGSDWADSDDTVDLRATAGDVVTAAADQNPRGGAAEQPPGARRRHRQWDRRPYDDAPTDVPDWVAASRGAPRSRRRLWTGIIAFVVLSVLTIGAGAFVTSDPRSEAFGRTPAVRGTPATEWFGDTAATDDDPTTDATPDEIDRPDTAAANDEGDRSGVSAAAPAGDDGPTGRSTSDDPSTSGAGASGSGAAGPDPGTPSSEPDPGTSTGGEPQPDPEPVESPGDPEPTDPPSDDPTDSPSESGGGTGGDGGSDAQQQAGASENPLTQPAPAQS